MGRSPCERGPLVYLIWKAAHTKVDCAWHLSGPPSLAAMTRSSGAPLVAGRVDKSSPWFQAAVVTLSLSSPYFAALTAASLAAAAVAADINAAPEAAEKILRDYLVWPGVAVFRRIRACIVNVGRSLCDVLAFVGR